MIKIGINGFGRIGRCIARAIYELNLNDIKIVAINTPATAYNCAHLLKYDSIHGTFNHNVASDESSLSIDGDAINIYNKRSIEEIPWNKHNIDVVMECTGLYNSASKSALHLKSGSKNVIISAPISDEGKTIVYGVNNHILTKEDNIISVGSCTTNCLAPIVHVLHKKIGILKGFMHTVHSYTNDQNVVDNNHKKDLRRARACGLSMIPTTTGATETIFKIMPELKGKLSGTATRVPTPNVSMLDLSFLAKKSVTVNDINELMREVSANELKNVVEVCDKPLVSIDFTHNTHSAIFDVSGTYVMDGDFCRTVSWYDNEWAFSVRMLDVARLMA